MDNKKILDDLLNIYEDPEKELILLMKDKLSDGIRIQLNNDKSDSLFNILHVNSWRNLCEYSCFLVFSKNYEQNYRQYCHKLLFFDDESHQYQIIVHQQNGHQVVYTKKTNWRTFLKDIDVDSNSLIEVKEISAGQGWDSVFRHSFLENEYSYYNKIKDYFRNILKNSNEKIVTKFHKRFLGKDNVDRKVFINTFEPICVSKNLLFLTSLATELIDKASVRTLDEIFNKVYQPIQEMTYFLKNGLIVNKPAQLPHHNLIKKSIQYEHNFQKLFKKMKVVVEDRSPLFFSYDKAVKFLLNMPEESLLKNFRSWKNYDIFYDDYYDLVNDGVLSKSLDEQLKIWAESVKFATFSDYPKDIKTLGQVERLILEIREHQALVNEIFKNADLYGSEDKELEQTLKKIFNIDPDF